MSKLKKILLSLVFAVGILISAWAGMNHFETKIRPHLFPAIQHLDFELIEADAGLYKSKERRAGKPTLLFYLPDDISTETQREYMTVITRAKQAKVKNINLLLVTRQNIDNVRNMKRLSGFQGTILLDPSGSILQKMQKFNPASQRADWTSVQLDAAGGIVKLNSGPSPEISWLE